MSTTIVPENYTLAEHGEQGLDDEKSIHLYGVQNIFWGWTTLCGAKDREHPCWDGTGPWIKPGSTHCPDCGKPICQYCLFWLEYWNQNR